jgi:hypothetical protein
MPDRVSGISEPGWHSGQVSHPSPDPVTRTVAPVTAINALEITAAQAKNLTNAGAAERRHQGVAVAVARA